MMEPNDDESRWASLMEVLCARHPDRGLWVEHSQHVIPILHVGAHHHTNGVAAHVPPPGTKDFDDLVEALSEWVDTVG